MGLMSLHNKDELIDYFNSTQFNDTQKELYTDLTKEYFDCLAKYKSIQEDIFSKKTEQVLVSDILK